MAGKCCGGIVDYSDFGSYRGFFTSVSSSAPLGLSVAGNPFQPTGTVAYQVVVSTDLAGPSQAVTVYVPLGDTSAKVLENGGYVMYQGGPVLVRPK